MTLRVTFLGTSGAVPTVDRNPSGILINREGDRLLFDCGEGTQQQMMRFGTGFDISHVFITHVHGDHIYGLPGLLETLDFNDREASLTICVPAGKRSYLESFLERTVKNIGFQVEIIGVRPDEVVYETEEYEIRTFDVDHRSEAVGYILTEYDRKGKFNRERAEELGVPVGPKFSELHNGNPVELEDGRIIKPEQVVGSPRPGRKLVYTGDTRPAKMTKEVATGAELLVHDGTFQDEHADRAAATGHSTAREAGRIAADASVKQLALVHISSRYGERVHDHKKQAQEPFDGEVVVPDDGTTIEIPYPNSDR
ncbi:ribonuclease Z [Salinarchaeum sp. IM2453]|uniref:ribonuclease Z n=1 Tax=Salinarchaeum sp. IM2453 TaxID=2862870 RepID=UPI001C831ECB|nr:ribonuclease Z [Salinarchaeum sp. IM2453]QZA89773.1 ribonuclease Z [Salinarchaeum sp. IM2453]